MGGEFSPPATFIHDRRQRADFMEGDAPAQGDDHGCGGRRGDQGVPGRQPARRFLLRRAGRERSPGAEPARDAHVRPRAAGCRAAGCVRLRTVPAIARRRRPRAADRPGDTGDHAERPRVGDRPRAGIRARERRLRDEAVLVSRAGGTDRSRSTTHEWPARSRHDRRGRPADRSPVATGDHEGRAGRSLGEGVRAAAHARRRADASVYKGRAVARRLGLHLDGATRTLDSHASRLRRKLGNGGRRWIVNVWGVGYRLTDELE